MKTENIHLMVTPLCDRTCKYCCNNLTFLLLQMKN